MDMTFLSVLKLDVFQYSLHFKSGVFF